MRNTKVIKEYKKTVQKELSTICEDILALLDTSLIPSSNSGDAKVFFLKMKGDYHRCVCLPPPTIQTFFWLGERVGRCICFFAQEKRGNNARDFAEVA